jgi:OmpA-OmpF porin, OOP family
LRTLGWIWSAVWLALAWNSAASSIALAQTSRGFTLQRYEPTAAGEWSFWADHPQYHEHLDLAVGLTLNYGHHPLVLGLRQLGGKFFEDRAIISQQVYGHLDLAVSMLGRLGLSLSLPVSLYENGQPAIGIEPGGVRPGDPRLGMTVRLYGEPLRDPFSVNLGAQVWIPNGGSAEHVGDRVARAAPRLLLAGYWRHLLWSFTSELLYRAKATIGNLPVGSGNTIGSEVQFGGSLAYADFDRHFTVGPEAVLATVVVGGDAFARDYTSLEVLLGGHYKIHDQWLLGLAGGLGALKAPGSPDRRLLVRVAYAPEDKPHKEMPPPVVAPPPEPELDRDGDGVLDRSDACPELAQGARPDAQRPGCPTPDRDGDGVFDDEDACVDSAGVRTPDPKTNGCPAPADRDADGVVDAQDQCPDRPAGAQPDSERRGCPLEDRDGDGDGVVDRDDQCPELPAGPNPHPSKPGCPTVRENKIVVDPIFFQTGGDAVLPESIPVLQSLADIMAANPAFQKVSIEGHTDDRGNVTKNLNLSARRATAVMRWLAAHGVEATRLESRGWGQARPLMSNETDTGRATNRRVEFVIVK